MEWIDHIESKEGVMLGKPCIKGTRIAVDLILEKLAWGETAEMLLQSYPHITADDIQACLLFASDSVRKERIYRAA